MKWKEDTMFTSRANRTATTQRAETTTLLNAPTVKRRGAVVRNDYGWT
jgi:hypothetical protein